MSPNIGYSLEVHNNATASLREIKKTNLPEFLRLFEFLRHLKTDEYLLSKMVENDFEVDEYGRSRVRKWWSVWAKDKAPIWRLRAFDLEKDGINYRFLYIFYWKDRTYHVLDVVHKSQLTDKAYDDPNNAIRKRLVAIVRNEFADA